MHKAKSAEHERRAMKLLATGQFEAAEREKLAAIQRAEGEKEALIRIAEGKARSIQLVNEAANKYFVGNAQRLKQLEVTETSLKDNAKIILTKDGPNQLILVQNWFDELQRLVPPPDHLGPELHGGRGAATGSRS